MYSPSFLALIIALLGVSPSSASPAIFVPSSSAAPSTSASKNLYSTNEYSHPVAALRFDNNDDIIVFPDNNFQAGCSFVARGRAYDLCPLLHLDRHAKDGSTRYDRVSSNRKGKERAKQSDVEVYFIGRRGEALVTNPCFEWAETCFIKREGPRMMVTAIRRDESTRSSKTAVYASGFESGGREFDLWLKSEEKDVRIVLKCAEDEMIYDSMLYHVASKETHALRWHTPHACPVEVVQGLVEAKAEDEKPATDKEDNDLKDDKLLVGGRSRAWISFMAILIVSMLIIVTVVISSPQARHYLLAHLQSAGHAILPFLQSFKLVTRPLAKRIPTFRVAESRLVRWAQEDMALNADEDFMVNGLNKRHQNSEVVNEYIPLKSSPGFYANGSEASSQVVSASWNYSTYGSMPFEALEVDESGVDMRWKQKSGVKELIRSASERASLKVKGLLRR